MASVLGSFDNNYDNNVTPLVRSINNIRWWSAIVSLEEFQDLNEVEASPPHGLWTWKVVRTNIPYNYLQNTYYDGQLIVSDPLQTNLADINSFINTYLIRY